MEDNKKIRERDFQRYVGWQVPFFIKIAWIILTLWIVVYLSTYLLPALKAWPRR